MKGVGWSSPSFRLHHIGKLCIELDLPPVALEQGVYDGEKNDGPDDTTSHGKSRLYRGRGTPRVVVLGLVSGSATLVTATFVAVRFIRGL